MKEQSDSLKRTARITGILYLVVIVCAGFSEGAVRGGIIIPGNALATAGNIMASESLFRLGFVTDLIAFLADAAISVLLYVLLKPVNKTLALISAAFRLLAHPAIAGINMLNHFIPLLLLNGPEYAAAFEPDQLNALSMLFLEVHGYGYLIGGAFFGVHCLLLGYLLYKSSLFPRILGIFLAVASIGYLTESFGMFLYPAYEEFYMWIVAIPAVVGELSLCVWLMVKGVKG